MSFWVLVAGVALLLVATAAVFAFRTNEDSYNPRQPANAPLQDQAFPELGALPLLDGTGTLDLNDLRGQVLVVNFFASYCGPCRAEHLELTTVFDLYRDRGVQFVGIVYQDTTEAASAFLDSLGWGEGYLYVQDPGSRAIVELGVFGVPETYFVTAEGTIAHKVYGAVHRDDLVPALDAILEGRPVEEDAGGVGPWVALTLLGAAAATIGAVGQVRCRRSAR